jgi:hypothetical protein
MQCILIYNPGVCIYPAVCPPTILQLECQPLHKNCTTHTLLSKFLHLLVSSKHNFIHVHCYLQYFFGTLHLDSKFSSGAGVSMLIHTPVYFADEGS